MSCTVVEKRKHGSTQLGAVNKVNCCDITEKTPLGHENTLDQPNVMTANNGNAQKSKATYSAQHQAPNMVFQQHYERNSNKFPNMETKNYPCCNAVPLYNVTSKMMHRGQNIPMENAVPNNNNMQHSCPCSSVPPPMPPCNNDLWDLQFCRWWGWNWIRKREEMMNQKKVEMKTKCVECATKEQKRKKNRRGSKRGDFFNWCNKLFKKSCKDELKMEEKKQLQELYDTPCSSITFNNCPCPANEWECRSLNLEGQYNCYCSSTRQTSTSTVVVQNKTRRQACKQNERKHQSWLCEKTDSSSSDECCSYVCVRPQRESSTEESVEYLSLRMAHMKSDCEDNLGCPSMKLKQKQARKNCTRNICCQCKAQKKQEANVCCPCRVKLVCEKRNNCACNKFPKQNYGVKQQRFTKCNCGFGCTQRKLNLPRCRILSPSRSLPICRTSPPPKIPRFRRLPPTCKCLQQNANPVQKNLAECRRRKRKNVDCSCLKKKEYILRCTCEHQPRKKLKRSEKPMKVYYCCCCCCHNCCCCGNSKSDSTDDTKAVGPKHEENCKQTSDKCIDSNNMNENANPNIASCCNNVCPQFCGIPNGNLGYNSPTGDYIQDNFVYNAMQFRVSAALQKGLYTSPVTGRPYSLNPKVYTSNKMLPQNNLPKPLNIDHKILNINPVESPIVDEEHKLLLTAVCDAIMSSRLGKENQYQNRTFDPPTGIQFLPSNNYLPNFDPLVTKNRNVYGSLESFDQRSVEVDLHDYSDDTKENGGFCSDLENFACNNIALDRCQQLSETYKNILAPNVLKGANFEMPRISEHKGLDTPDFKNFLSSHFDVPKIVGNEKLETSAFRNFLPPDVSNFEPLKVRESENIAGCNQQLVENTRKTRIPVRRKKYSSIQQLSLSEFEKPNDNIIQNTFQIGQINPDNDFKGIYSDADSSENCNKEDSLLENSLPDSSNPPTIQKSSAVISAHDSNESLCSRKDFFSLIKNCTNLSDSLIPFHTQQNWMKPSKLPGLTVTGLFSTSSGITKLPSDPNGIKGRNKNESINIEHLKKGRLYNMLFSSDHSDYCEDFLKVPYNFRPISVPPCMIQHPTAYPSFIVQKSPLSDDTKETQTKQSVEKAHHACVCKKSSEKQLECDCMSSGKHSRDKKKVEKETSCKSLLEGAGHSKSPRATTSKATKVGNIAQFKSVQADTSKGPEANVTMHRKLSKASETNATAYSKLPQASTSKTVDTNTSTSSKSPRAGTSKTADISASSQLKSPQDGTLKGTKVSSTSGLKPSPVVSSKIGVDSKLPTTGSSKAAVISPTVQSKSPQTSMSKKTEASGAIPLMTSQGGSSRGGGSKAGESSSFLKSKLAHAADSETDDDMQQVNQSVSFVDQNSEREMGCTFFHVVDSKKLQKCKRCVTSFPNATSSDYFDRNSHSESEEKCLYFEHEPQNLNFISNADSKTGTSEKLLSIVNRISEAPFHDPPFLTKDVQTSSSFFGKPKEAAVMEKFTSTTEYQNLFPKSFISATTSPFSVDATTSPFKIKYTTARARDRSQTENFIREKVPKRESPFSMFCRPVPSRNIAQASPLIDETQSLSRPERQIVVGQSKKLKVREKRWRY